MPELNRYSEINNVVQRSPITGCIPWAIEWMIRYKGVIHNYCKIPEVNLTNFQDDYDLAYRQIASNSFDSVVTAIKNDCN